MDHIVELEGCLVSRSQRDIEDTSSDGRALRVRCMCNGEELNLMGGSAGQSRCRGEELQGARRKATTPPPPPTHHSTPGVRAAAVHCASLSGQQRSSLMGLGQCRHVHRRYAGGWATSPTPYATSPCVSLPGSWS